MFSLGKAGIGVRGHNAHIVVVARSLCRTVSAHPRSVALRFICTVADARRSISTSTRTTARKLRSSSQRLLQRGTGRIGSICSKALVFISSHLKDAGHIVERTSIIDGVCVVSLKDRIAIKLRCGLNNPGRSKDLAHVEDLIRSVPLDKRFAAKLPTALRAPFEHLVNGVRAAQKFEDKRRF